MKTRRRTGRSVRPRRSRPSKTAPATRIATLSAKDRRALQKKIKSQTPISRWNPDQDDVQRSVVQLVLTLVELIRRLMERQAIRRMSERSFAKGEAEAVGTALMEIERTVHRLAKTFNLKPEDLNLDLQAIKLL